MDIKHYGGDWHVSVTTGFKCVDLRKWYVVRAVRGDKSEADEDGYRFAFARMAETLTDHRVPSPRLSRRCQLHTVFPLLTHPLDFVGCIECNPYPQFGK